MRLEVREAERIAWYWTYLVGVPDVDGVLVVRDHEVLPAEAGTRDPRRRACGPSSRARRRASTGRSGSRRSACGSTHPDEALRAGGEIGERIAVGLDIEWEVGDGGPPAGTVHGDVLVGRARHEIDGPGWFYDDGVAGPG